MNAFDKSVEQPEPVWANIVVGRFEHGECTASEDNASSFDTNADTPFDVPELFARIRALIRGKAGHAVPQIKLGDVVIDPRSRTVMKADIPIGLTAREFRILEYLAMHRGKVVSRTKLHDHILDENEDTLSTFSTCMSIQSARSSAPG